MTCNVSIRDCLRGREEDEIETAKLGLADEKQ